MTDTRRRHSATYLYPGAFFPEETTRQIKRPTLASAIAAQPDDRDGYFRKSGWYAVRIATTTERRFVAENGDETWVREGKPEVLSVIVGERIHYTEIPDTDANAILISNIRGNSKDGFGVKTRAGNWQIASDYDEVISSTEQVSA